VRKIAVLSVILKTIISELFAVSVVFVINNPLLVCRGDYLTIGRPPPPAAKRRRAAAAAAADVVPA
jgi:hypothetical protein